MKYIKRVIIDENQEKELKEIGFVLSFRYAVDPGVNTFDVYVKED